MPQWNILKLLEWLTDYFQTKDIESPRLTAEHLIAHTLKATRMDLYLQFDRPLTQEELTKLKPLIERRTKREPLEYILGTQPFRNLEIKVNKNVLIPRPETEILVDKILEHIPNDVPINILEIGTGSGAISASIASERANAKIIATDISEEALTIAKENISIFKDQIELKQGSLFEPIKERKFNLIVSNPPYIPVDVWSTLAPEVKDFEPKLSLVAGNDGLDFYRQIFKYAHNHLSDEGKIFLEFGDDQAKQIKELITQTKKYTELETFTDLAGKKRIISAKLKGGTNG